VGKLEKEKAPVKEILEVLGVKGEFVATSTSNRIKRYLL
jgi:hypothetical protein